MIAFTLRRYTGESTNFRSGLC